MNFPAMTGFIRGLAVLLIAASATVAIAQTEDKPAPKGKTEQKAQSKGVPHPDRAKVPDPGALRLLPPDSVTHHTLETGGGPIRYTATAGTLPLYDTSGERVAAVFYTAYVADPQPSLPPGRGREGPGRRPVTFAFNGGPGAASAYLNLGLAGPRIADFSSGQPDANAMRLHDNPDSWLQFTDLVMIDPVGAGFSRATKADGGRQFWSVARDTESVAKVVSLWLTNNQRMESPKFLLGESYGGFRAGKVATALRDDHGISVAGIIMASPLMEGAFTFGGTRFALGAAMQIPSLAAAELQRRGLFTPERLAEAERFALNEYLTTLAGPPPRGEAARAFYARVAELTGLPLDVVTQTRGFIRDSYVKHLRAAERLIVSRYDVTFTAPDPYPEDPARHGPDPILDGLSRGYGSLMSAYVREELGYRTEMTYVLLSGEANGRWEWGNRSGRDNASLDRDLRTLLTLDPSFRLLVAHGYTDLVTPYSVSRYVLDHLPDFATPARVQLKVYQGGHMFYVDPASRRAFTADARSFYEAEP
jgi:carboxypeptidase C (cathepsin A)